MTVRAEAGAADRGREAAPSLRPKLHRRAPAEQPVLPPRPPQRAHPSAPATTTAAAVTMPTRTPAVQERPAGAVARMTRRQAGGTGHHAIPSTSATTPRRPPVLDDVGDERRAGIPAGRPPAWKEHTSPASMQAWQSSGSPPSTSSSRAPRRRRGRSPHTAGARACRVNGRHGGYLRRGQAPGSYRCAGATSCCPMATVDGLSL